MAPQAVIPGDVNDAGKFVPRDLDLFRESLLARAGRATEVVLRDIKSKRSLDQNAYAHKWPFRIIAEAMGEGIEAAKLCILGEKFGWHEVMGKLLPIKPSTSALTVEEFSELIEWMPPWALEMFGSIIPLPNEVPE